MMNTSYNQYMKELEDEQGLSREEEMEHFTAYKAEKNRKSYNKIFTSNAKFAVKMAHQYKNQGVELEDLIGAGNLGLSRAIEEFEPETGNKFISYAVWWIRQHIMEQLARQSRIVSITGVEASKKHTLDKLANKLRQKLFREPSIHELCDAFKDKYNLKEFPIKQVERMETLNPQPSLSSPIGDKGSVERLQDVIADDKVVSPLENTEKTDLKHKLINLIDSLSTLSDKERIVIKSYYGISENRAVFTLDGIGTILNCTRERVRQMRNSALEKMRKVKHLNMSLVNS